MPTTDDEDKANEQMNVSQSRKTWVFVFRLSAVVVVAIIIAGLVFALAR